MSVVAKNFMRKNLNLFTAILCLLISWQAVCAQNIETGKRVLVPTVFAPGLISTGDYEAAEEFAPDGKSLYFIKSTPDFNFWTMVFSNFENGRWSAPKVAPFSGQYSDADPFITADGKSSFLFRGDRSIRSFRRINRGNSTFGRWIKRRPATGASRRIWKRLSTVR